MSVIEVDATKVPSQFLNLSTNLAVAAVASHKGDYSTPEKVTDLLTTIFRAMLKLDAEVGNGGGSTSAGETPASGDLDPVAQAPTTEVGDVVDHDGVDDGVDEDALDRIDRPEAKSLQGSALVASPWAALSEETRSKFEELVRKHGLARDERGYPIPKTPDGTIGGDKYVLDPFGGGRRYSMLKRRLTVHDLTEDDLIRFFGWEGKEVRLVSRKYSEQKRRESIETGFVREKGKKVGPRRSKARETEKV